MWRDKAHVNPSLTMKTMGWGQSYLLILSGSVALNLPSALCFFRLEVSDSEVGVHRLSQTHLLDNHLRTSYKSQSPGPSSRCLKIFFPPE